MVSKTILAFTLVFVLAEAQRPFYAGLRPIGVPEVESNALGNRFGEDAGLPLLVRGDGNLVNRFNQMPVDQRPFWYTNSAAYDTLRSQPQTYPQKPNSFLNA